MYVYTGEKMRGWPYRRKLVPSFEHRGFPALGTDQPAPAQNAVGATRSNLVRVALAVAAGAVAWKLYESFRREKMVSNLPGFPGIGPLFNVGAAIGPAFSLGPWIL